MLSFSNMTIFAKQTDTSRMHSTVCKNGDVVNCFYFISVKNRKKKEVTRKKRQTYGDALNVLNVLNGKER